MTQCVGDRLEEDAIIEQALLDLEQDIVDSSLDESPRFIALRRMADLIEFYGDTLNEAVDVAFFLSSSGKGSMALGGFVNNYEPVFLQFYSSNFAGRKNYRYILQKRHLDLIIEMASLLRVMKNV